MEDDGEVVEPLHLDFEDREVYLAKIPVRAHEHLASAYVCVWK